MSNLGPAALIPLGEGRTFRVGGEEIAVFRLRDGRVLATQARCPHQGGPLADGIVGNDKLLCPLHGYRFELSSGRSLGPCPDLRIYPIALDERGHLIVKT